MPDDVDIQVLNNGERNLIIKLTGKSDGTGETNVKKVDLTNYGCDKVSLLKVDYDIRGMGIDLFWKGTPNKRIITLSEGQCELSWEDVGGLVNDANNSNGNILLTTLGANANDTYTITLFLKKKYE